MNLPRRKGGPQTQPSQASAARDTVSVRGGRPDAEQDTLPAADEERAAPSGAEQDTYPETAAPGNNDPAEADPPGEDSASLAGEAPSETDLPGESGSLTEDEGPAGEDEYYDEDDYEEERPSLGRRMIRALLIGLLKLFFWLVMVALCVLGLVAAVGYFLYQSTTEDQLPLSAASFAGQALVANDYTWELPVMGPLHRTYNLADSLAAAAKAAEEAEDEEEAEAAALLPPDDPQILETVVSVSPALVLPDGMESRLEILAAGSDTVVFSGDAADFSRFVFSENGSYDATLTVGLGEQNEPDPSEPVGHYTYRFRFILSARPQVTLSSGTVMEGSVLGLRVTGLTGDLSPWVTSELGSASFVRQGGSWVAYLPLPESFIAGEYPLEIIYGDTRETVTVQTVYRQTQELDTFTADGSAAIPYMGAAPAVVQELFEIADPEVYWTDSGFIQPVQGRTVRNYAVIEYTDRVVDKELLALDPAWVEYNKTIPGRRSLNVTFATRPGVEIVAPADGRVVYAGIAAGSRCVVIEHGCGLKSVFYLLGRIDVAEGDYVIQGTPLGTAQGHTICEVRLGASPLNPWEVWGNYGGLAF